MNKKLKVFVTLLFLLLLVSGCAKKTFKTNIEDDVIKKQKMMAIVIDKQTKTPIKDAKVYILGDNTTYTTDIMGKTPEILVEINKDYFDKYIDEISKATGFGFINIITAKEGYGKHIELDYNIYPGNSVSIVKIELSKGKKTTSKVNVPDTCYIENILKLYENYEGKGIKSENTQKYKVCITDQGCKPLKDAKVVVPEANFAAKTDVKGNVEFYAAFDTSGKIELPIKKDYSEISILVYKEGFNPKAYLKVHVNKDGKNNSCAIKIKKYEKSKVDYEIVQPKDKWMIDTLNYFK